MNTEAENLGRLAAECELRATDPRNDEWERLSLLRSARIYRDAQFSALAEQDQPGMFRTWHDPLLVVILLSAATTLGSIIMLLVLR